MYMYYHSTVCNYSNMYRYIHVCVPGVLSEELCLALVLWRWTMLFQMNPAGWWGGGGRRRRRVHGTKRWNNTSYTHIVSYTLLWVSVCVCLCECACKCVCAFDFELCLSECECVCVCAFNFELCLNVCVCVCVHIVHVHVHTCILYVRPCVYIYMYRTHWELEEGWWLSPHDTHTSVHLNRNSMMIIIFYYTKV